MDLIKADIKSVEFQICEFSDIWIIETSFRICQINYTFNILANIAQSIVDMQSSL